MREMLQNTGTREFLDGPRACPGAPTIPDAPETPANWVHLASQNWPKSSLEHIIISSRSRTLARLLFIHLPGHIPTGEMKIDPARNVLPNHLGFGSGAEGAFVGVKESLAITRLRTKPQHRSEGQPVHHAEASMIVGLKNQRVDIVAPDHIIL